MTIAPYLNTVIRTNTHTHTHSNPVKREYTVRHDEKQLRSVPGRLCELVAVQDRNFKEQGSYTSRSKKIMSVIIKSLQSVILHGTLVIEKKREPLNDL